MYQYLQKILKNYLYKVILLGTFKQYIYMIMFKCDQSLIKYFDLFLLSLTLYTYKIVRVYRWSLLDRH